jgi:probable F420-dependent oxidoreductase
MTRAFRFGVGPAGLPGRPGAAERWPDFARRVEDLGYDAVNVGDHLDARLAPLVALAAAGAVTDRLRLGTFLLANDYRNPLVLAQEFATLAALYPGRVEAGIGAGWLAADYHQAAIQFDRPGMRIDRLAAAVHTLQRFLAADQPEASLRPPIVMGGGGRRVLALAAMRADIIAFNVSLGAGRMGAPPGASASAAQVADRVRWVADSAGERYRDLEFQVYVHAVEVRQDRLAAAARVAERIGLTTEEALESPHVLAGPHDYIVEALQERRQRYGFSYISIGGDAVEPLAPVVARLAGT